MSDKTTPRLMAAAKEFNIGKETLVDFLVAKGFSKDELKPAAKLTEDMYRSLQQEFQGDKVAKLKSDQIDLHKGGVGDIMRRQKEEIVTQQEEQQSPFQDKVQTPASELVVEEKKGRKITKLKSPEIEGPKIISKIDLSSIDSSTRPKKGAKKETKKTDDASIEKKPTAKTKAKVKEEDKQPVEPVITPTEKVVEKKQPTVEEKLEPIIENIKVDRLTGPKILGKIDLPIDNDTRPKHEKRKRIRIPVDKKSSANTNTQPPTRKDFNQSRPNTGSNNNNRRTSSRSSTNPREDRAIDQKQIQEKIRQTQAKLSGSRGGKSLKSKYRRAKREDMADAVDEELDNNKLQVTEFVTVSDLSSLMDVSFADIISKCMSLGIMVSINQRLDAEVIELVAGEFGFEVEFIGIKDATEMEEIEEEEDPKNLVSRPPIVTIMGHVDHGKTSLLDYIRSATVVAGEAGGITQHIGAYEVTLPNGKMISFLDTPGHEAFTAMRARGAKVTDIAVIVVAADDALMPQTKEAISHAQAAGVPMIFAINKIDKEGSNPEKIREQLAGMNLLVEEWGGKYQSQEISAKKGTNIDALLEKILLEAELLDLKANPNREAGGTIIEASLDKGRGYVATVLVQNGTLRIGNTLVSGQHVGKVKAMFNERNQKVTEAPPSTPVLILGLSGAPQAGEKFKVYEDESEAKEIAGRWAQIMREQGIRAKKHITLDEIGRRLALGNFKQLNLIIKGDVDGSVEALSDSLQKLSTEEIAVSVVHKAVGQITESDVLLATASDAIIIGFNVRPSLQAAKLAENEGVQINMYSIIYNAIEEIKSAMEGMLEPKFKEKITANVEVRETYKFDKGTVAGCFVTDGKLARNAKIRLVRNGIVVFSGELGSLKRFKDDAKDVQSGMECGLSIKNYNDIKVGDVVEAYEEEEVKRTL